MRECRRLEIIDDGLGAGFDYTDRFVIYIEFQGETVRRDGGRIRGRRQGRPEGGEN